MRSNDLRIIAYPYFVDFEQFFKLVGLCFHLVKNYGKLFLNLAPPPKKIKYVPPPLLWYYEDVLFSSVLKVLIWRIEKFLFQFLIRKVKKTLKHFYLQIVTSNKRICYRIICS